MNNKFNFGALIASVIVGLITVNLFAFLSGPNFANAFFPTLAILSGFVITGFVVGIITKDITISEPGIGSILVSAISFFTIPAMNLYGLQTVADSDWIVIYLNGIILTFLGAWLGEKLQQGHIAGHHEQEKVSIDWSWVVAGTAMGIIVSVILVLALDLIFGPNPSSFVIPFIIALFFTGLVIGWKSPGITIREAGIAGFLTVTIDLDIIRITLSTDSNLSMPYILIALALGFVVTIAGGWIGEKIQGSNS